ncbi:hypothetical protein JCM16777_2171 [Leptotrichia wadei]|nr:hypothetical protein JCM16777_2171 [Leptotrichia wadei]
MSELTTEEFNVLYKKNFKEYFDKLKKGLQHFCVNSPFE